MALAHLKSHSLIGLIVALVLTCLLAFGCAPSDEERIQQTMSSEFDTFQAAATRGDNEASSVLGDDAKQALEQAGIDPASYVSALFDGFEYRIDSIEVDKDSATAHVVITCKSVNDVINSLQSDLQDSLNSGSGTNLTSEQISQNIAEQTLSYLQEAQPREKEPVDISLHKQDKLWVVDAQTRSKIEQALM